MGANSSRYEFACSHCSERVVVDALVQKQLLGTGCVFCGRNVSERDFVRER
ncbi:hypothetical protein [Natronococcus sp. A-GB7]|uniref:DUF7560 family zinc ribbon protein n=1 Tax=Natronococcus sp. A-GB7 TaxID=3037649 RepID=UPI00241F6561|nr:hypothetical protein [Natronococcus sp. A-GB7]MDG5820555.1 hypothetical protein [Natronococcus sp. A-GB7]